MVLLSILAETETQTEKTPQLPACEPTLWWMPRDSVSEKRFVAILAKMVRHVLSQDMDQEQLVTGPMLEATSPKSLSQRTREYLAEAESAINKQVKERRKPKPNGEQLRLF
jgi:hypothetical protein